MTLHSDNNKDVIIERRYHKHKSANVTSRVASIACANKNTQPTTNDLHQQTYRILCLYRFLCHFPPVSPVACMKATLPRVDSLSWLGSLQAWPLKRLAFLTGIRSTGTKNEIRSLLEDSLIRPRLPHANSRILSVDMGVKNLAFCLLDVRQTGWNSGKSSPLCLSKWKRLDLSNRLMSGSASGVAAKSPSTTSEGDDPIVEDASSVAPQADMYSPPQLSKVAYTLASEFVSHKPDVILIERQRFRSGGAPAIQEWTVRVNMLESMLWACFETMRHERGSASGTSFPDVVPMGPRTIGSYWLAQAADADIAPADVSYHLGGARLEESTAAPSETKRSSLEKKDKIALVRSWLRPESKATAFDAALDPVVSLFRPSVKSSVSKLPRKRKGKTVESDISSNADDAVERVAKSGKLDDLADCLVQGVTFALWEENRRRVLEYGQSLDRKK